MELSRWARGQRDLDFDSCTHESTRLFCRRWSEFSWGAGRSGLPGDVVGGDGGGQVVAVDPGVVVAAQQGEVA